MDEGDLERHGGQEISTLQVAAVLAARGHQIDLLYHRDGSLSPEYRTFCDSMRRVMGVAADRDRFFATALGSLAMATSRPGARPDVVFVNQPAGVAHGAVLAARLRVPLVCHLHLPVVEWPWPVRVGLRRVDRFIAVSESIRRDYVADGADPDRIDLVHNGIDIDVYRPVPGAETRQALGIHPDAFVVLFAGRLDPPKGVDVLLDAFSRLGLAPEEGRVVLVGAARGGSGTREVGAYAERLRAMLPADQCTWLPRQDDMLPFYAAADVVAVPSLWEEPFGRVVIEAMACGRPVVASAVGGIREILTGPMARLLVPKGDARALAGQLGALRGWTRRDPELGTRAREHVADNFSLAAAAAGIEASLLRACSRPPVAA